MNKNDLDDCAGYLGTGFLDSNIIMSDSPGILIDKAKPLTFYKTSAKPLKRLEKVAEGGFAFKLSYLTGAALGSIGNVWARYYLASQFESVPAKIGAALLPELATTFAGIATTFKNRYTVAKEFGPRSVF